MSKIHEFFSSNQTKKNFQFCHNRPSIDRTLKPTSNESLAEGNLRSVLIPQDTMFKFLLLAAKNTASNIETCGILAGRLVCIDCDFANFYRILKIVLTLGSKSASYHSRYSATANWHRRQLYNNE